MLEFFSPCLPTSFPGLPPAKHCSLNFFPACKNSSLSRLQATAWDKESAPYIKASKPTAFSRLSLPASTIWANDLMKLDRSSSRALRYGSPARATSAAALGRRQPVSLQSRCWRVRYCLITLSARALSESPLADFRRLFQFARDAFCSTWTNRSSFESKWL